MSDVVLRCPNCGTTKSAMGECEACHEAQVRYYCTNHSPGRWLEASACAQCGARFGDPPRPAVVTPPPPPPRRARGSAPPAPRSPTAARAGPPARRPEVSSERGHTGFRRPGAEAPDAPDERVEAPFASWQELLWALARARRARIEAPTEREIARPGRGFSGCLVRLVLIVVFLFLAFVLAPILFGGLLFGIY